MPALQISPDPVAIYTLTDWPVVRVDVHRSPRDAQEWLSAYLEPLARDLRKRPRQQFVVVVDIAPGVALDAVTRKAMKDFLLANADVYDRCPRTALVPGSAVARYMATAVTWLLPRGIAMFGDIGDAERWARAGLT